MTCKIHIRIYDAKNVFNIDNISSNPYVKCWFKGKQDSAIKTKTIYNTLNPSWNQDLDIISNDYNSDILQICMYTEDNEISFPIMDIYEYPLRYRLLGEHLVFNEEVKNQNKYAGILHFELDFLISPETLLNKEILNEQDSPKQENNDNPNNNNNIIASDLQTDILALKKENNELKQQFKEVLNQTTQQTSEIKADLQELKKENKELLKKLNEKSDMITDITIKSPTNYLINENDEKFYEVNEKIRENDISIVYKITDKRTLRTICKTVLKIDKRTTTIQDFEDSIKDFEFLCSLHHPCICDAIGISKSEPVKTDDDDSTKTVAFFFEFCPNSLKELIEKKMIDNTLKIKIVIEIVHAMIFIHNHGIIHRNLAVCNILFNSIFEVKIINTGISQIFDRLSENNSIEPAFMPPEILNNQEFDTKTDVYSFGVVLYYIFCGKLPEIKKNDDKKLNLPKPSMSISSFCIDLISKCLKTNPIERPTFKEILDEIKHNSYGLASDIDESIISRRDEELLPYDSMK